MRPDQIRSLEEDLHRLKVGDLLAATNGHVDPKPDRYAGRAHSPDSMTSLLQLPVEPTAWRVHGLVADGTATILSAEAGAGKSVLMATLCDGVTEGRVIAGMPCAKGVALYIDGEMGPKMFTNRLRTAGAEACAFWYVDAMGLDISIESPDDLGWIRRHIERVGANLVVIDSLRRLMPSRSENDSDDMAPAVGAVTKLARDTNAAIVLVHHKGDGEKFYRGSSAIKDQADALFALLPVNPEDDDDLRRRLTCRGTRGKAPRYDVATPDQFIEVDFTNGGVVAVVAPEDVGPQIPAREAVAVAIKAALPVKYKQEAAEKIGRHAKDQTFGEAWGDLKRAGEIVQISGHWVGSSSAQTLGSATTTTSAFDDGEGNGAVAR